ncbi:mycothiol synthase [Pseudonocardia thermophila]|uniref:mycothiol synthase n=1 Tax=Pseudonocardia thermophila TaxID=1848 RepID=UPI00248E511B|nr:mycothiol synthase [Pseudonocardia thermophila]
MAELIWAPPTDPAAVTSLIAAATKADGDAPIGENVLLHLSEGDNLQVREGDELVGFAHLDPPAADGSRTAELTVHPDARGRGLGAQIVAALIERTDGVLRVWAHGDHPAAAALAARFGFARTRELWRMRRPLAPTDVFEPQLPDGVRLRAFVVGQDEQEFLRVNNAAFDWHPEQGGWDVEQVRLREAEPWFDPQGFLLAVDAEDRLLGFHWTKIHHDQEPPVGEVYVLGVDPSARGLHLGSALTLAGLAHLRDRGLGEVMLYVESDNAPAIRVYSQLGFRHTDTDVNYSR